MTLVHGAPHQIRYPLFESQHFISLGEGGPLTMMRFLHGARQWLRTNASRFDVFHGLGAFHNTVAPAFLGHQLGLPAVIFVANHGVELTDKSGLKRVLGWPRRRRAMIKQLSSVVAMSEAIYDELIEHGLPARKIARIPMGVDVNRFRPHRNVSEQRALRATFGWRDIPTLVFVGGINQRKQPHLLVEALGLLKNRGVELQLVLVGPEQEPDYAARIRQRANELGVADRVVWFGFTADIAPPFRAADIFALPSANEGMPAALVEAMASGLPSIVTAISGMTDLIVDGQHGRIVEPRADRIADALEAYSRDPALRQSHGASARRKVEQRYSTGVVIDAYERLFRRIIAGGDAAE